MDTKSVYNPIVEDLWLYTRNNKKILVTAYYHWGNIICTDLNGVYVDNWVSGFFDECKGFRLVGKIIRPRYDTYHKRWSLMEKQRTLRRS